MSASKSDRLGRNPFDRGTYTEQATKEAKTTKSAKTKAKPKAKAKANPDTGNHKSARAARTKWRLVLSELDRRAPQAVRDLKICKRVAALADFASARLSQFARHLEA